MTIFSAALLVLAILTAAMAMLTRDVFTLVCALFPFIGGMLILLTQEDA